MSNSRSSSLSSSTECRAGRRVGSTVSLVRRVDGICLLDCTTTETCSTSLPRSSRGDGSACGRLKKVGADSWLEFQLGWHVSLKILSMNDATNGLAFPKEGADMDLLELGRLFQGRLGVMCCSGSSCCGPVQEMCRPDLKQ